MNVYKTFRRHPGCKLCVLWTFKIGSSAFVLGSQKRWKNNYFFIFSHVSKKHGDVLISENSKYSQSLPDLSWSWNCRGAYRSQKCLQNPVKQLRWSVLRTFFQHTPSKMFGRVLNTPLYKINMTILIFPDSSTFFPVFNYIRDLQVDVYASSQN